MSIRSLSRVHETARSIARIGTVDDRDTILTLNVGRTTKKDSDQIVDRIRLVDHTVAIGVENDQIRRPRVTGEAALTQEDELEQVELVCAVVGTVLVLVARPLLAAARN